MAIIIKLRNNFVCDWDATISILTNKIMHFDLVRFIPKMLYQEIYLYNNKKNVRRPMCIQHRLHTRYSAKWFPCINTIALSL